MKRIFLLAGILALGACSDEPGSEKWCAAKQEQPKTEWTASDLATYTKNCLIEGSAVGSEEWCKDMSDTPKGEWTAEDTATYAKHCVL
jgi:hypothetical protein